MGTDPRRPWPGTSSLTRQRSSEDPPRLRPGSRRQAAGGRRQAAGGRRQAVAKYGYGRQAWMTVCPSADPFLSSRPHARAST
ncbi:MAG: hypothetical protein DLM67_04930 [Candidatus Nephthysia bennettiae]|nr:MAG: hypothetical protein DLM67_04930 [Candidatus Dormibacteraeota bacterium]